MAIIGKSKLVSYVYYIDGSIMPTFGNTFMFFENGSCLSEELIEAIEKNIKNKLEIEQELDIIEVTVLGING